MNQHSILLMVLWMAIIIIALFIFEKIKSAKAWKNAEEKIKQAEEKSREILKEARTEANEIIKKSEKIEERILDREEKIEKKLEQIQEKQEKIITKENDLIEVREKMKDKESELEGKLSEIAKLSEEQAKELFLKEIKEKYSDDGLVIIEKHKKIIEDKKTEAAREIILKSIQQYAGDVTNEVTTTMIEIPSDDIKWKLIWKEGRNITTFEKMAQVALIIDDTPDTVFISGFDLFRRYIAKKSLEKLIEDGRIQPARIEEIVENTTAEAEILLKELGQKTLADMNITTIPDELIPIIWKLRFRTSYGQNILKHSMETAYIAESIASDLGLDPKIAKIGWLLHDIWKALDHDIEGTHPEIWAKLAKKYNLDSRIVEMIEDHHGESSSISIYAAIAQVADAISSVRPWARRENIEQYVKRVQEMEALVTSFPWVSKAYAISSGREIRVIVDAKTVSDLEAAETAKAIAENIQENMTYPWEVKVSLMREMRVIEYAK